MRALLFLPSLLYRVVTSVRNFLYDSRLLPTYKSPLRVICVGNITAGGSGKTPLVQAVVRHLQKEGYKPVVLLRGYGGSVSGPYSVHGTSSSQQVGDEAVLHSRALSAPVVVARDRVAGAKYIEANQLGDCIVLDDGYQHRRLHRDLNIVTIDVRDERILQDMQSDRLLPAGLLRETVSQGFSRADLVVLHHRGPKLSAEKLDPMRSLLPKELPTFEMWISNAELVRGEHKLSPPHDVVLVTGIARPAGVTALVQNLGFSILKHQAFSDHASFCPEQIVKLRKEYSEVPFICTEKDFVRLDSSEGTKWWKCVPTFEIADKTQFLCFLGNSDRDCLG